MRNADADAAEALAACPTEAPLLCSENVSQELRQTRASHEEKQRMLEILQRVHDADAAERPASGLPGGDAEAAEIAEDVLSDDTVARLLEQVERSSVLRTLCLSLVIIQLSRSTNECGNHRVHPSHTEVRGSLLCMHKRGDEAKKVYRRTGCKHALLRMQGRAWGGPSGGSV